MLDGAYGHEELQPNTETRADGFVNVLNRFNTAQDNSTHYTYEGEGLVPDAVLTEQYELGLFAKIIDAPAEEAVKHGFELGIKSPAIEEYVSDISDELNIEQGISQALKWARLYGGSIAVILIDDGRGLDEPLNMWRVKSIDDIRVYERSIVEPDYTSVYRCSYEPDIQRSLKRKNFGMPEYYTVNSMTGRFTVHESRCLVFRNGILPEQTAQSLYRFWGIPEYVRMRRELREAITSHSYGVKMLERSVQPVYKQRGLADLLATEHGEDEVLKRLITIDMARGILNSIAIDSEGEDYDFKSFPYTGVKDIIDTTCNMLSAVSNIPQTILFGRSPAGMNATGRSDLENYYNYVERIQKLMVKDNLTRLIDIIMQAGVNSRELDEFPKIRLKFKPLWSLSDAEQSQLDQQKAAAASTRAATAKIYVEMGVLDPSEVRRSLASEDEYDIETMLDNYDDEELWANAPEPPDKGVTEDSQLDSPVSVDAAYAAIKQRYEERHSTDYASGGISDSDGGNENAPGSKASKSSVASMAGKIRDRLQNRKKATGVKPDKAEPPKKKILTKTMLKELYKQIKQEIDTDSNDYGSVGVIVLKDGCVLAGVRGDNGLVCGPGGHIERGEIPIMAAVRETREEFGISPTSLISLGTLEGLGEGYGKPEVFLCTKYRGKPRCGSVEMDEPFWLKLGSKAADVALQLAFEPFAKSLKLLDNKGFSDYHLLTTGGKSGKITVTNNTDANVSEWVKIGSNAQSVHVEEGQTVKEAVEGFVEEKEAEREAENSKAIDINVKPTVTNPQLQSIVDKIYKGQGGKGQIGNGTMMDAVRNEIKTGERTKGRYHSKKARQSVTQLKNRIGSGKLNVQEKQIARALIDDLKKALSGN